MAPSERSVEIVSFGEPMVEFNASTVGRLKDIDTFERGYGGDTSNMVVALSKLGHSCGYMTKIGDDEFGKCLLDLWNRERIDTSRVLLEKNGFTAIYFVSRTTDGRHEFTYFRKGSAASHFGSKDLDMEYLNRAKIFHTSGITQAISQSCREAVDKALEVLDRTRAKFSYDPNLRLRLWSLEEARPVILKTMGQSDIVFPSLEDAGTLFGGGSAEDIIRKIIELGARLVVLKLGPNGSVVADTRNIVRVPSFPVEVVDTTGAGDAFDAGFLAAILEGKSIREAATFANAVAALKCLGKGAIVPQPKRDEVDLFLEQARLA